MNKKKTLLICFIILLVGGAFTTLIFSTEPTAQRSGATAETAMLVNVTEVQRDTYRPTIRVMGTVEPSQDIVLSPRVDGEIIERSDSFTPGGYVEKGDKLLQIDPSDYKNALQQRKSELTQALSNMKVEMGRQEAAQREYQLYGDTLSKQSESLVLREPQLEAVKSQVQSARAAVEQAELELQRATIRAPFDAHILSRNVNVGSLVGPGDSLGRLIGMDTYWVEATVPLSQLRWLNFPDGNQEGSEVRIRNRTAWPQDEYRVGHLHKLVGALENQTRMAQVLISVPDPQSRDADNLGQPALMVGSFVEASIKARELPDVFRLNRDYIRTGETVWVMEDGKLRIRDVDIVFRDAQYAYIGDGLNEQDQVVTTNLSTVVDGASLRLEGSESEAQQDPPQNTAE
ncbi:efflux RND transporter periplasmic adaptor subunit [Aliifodinibius sp. S!AR15-10]|uniref:efflux RND transporter periplasmic adaptor subunit n=1 Tax=Aliifodinibius sp. S!AR15-10 TaxID=2950437 RepID=UPI002858A882|nr:efflux RND transporter periplasmic adaptor subunit [Aliifodinibius sp. S!AR15-10]MDR8393187.1 efflux RND transporter periplasmic adaptor subunit [Aliifodinibius sp. S!AR15-10]